MFGAMDLTISNLTSLSETTQGLGSASSSLVDSVDQCSAAFACTIT
jgi:hypothetical protein